MSPKIAALIIGGLVFLFLGAIISALKGLIFIALIAIGVGLLGWRIRVHTHRNLRTREVPVRKDER